VKEEIIVLAILAVVLITATILPYTPASISGQQTISVQTKSCQHDPDCKTANPCMTGKCTDYVRTPQGTFGKCVYKPIECQPKDCKKTIGCSPSTGCMYEASQAANGLYCGLDRSCCNGECMTNINAFKKCGGEEIITIPTELPQFTTREICEILSETKARKPSISLPPWIEKCVKAAGYVDWGFIYDSIRNK
jgi:hypothetical protein